MSAVDDNVTFSDPPCHFPGCSVKAAYQVQLGSAGQWHSCRGHVVMLLDTLIPAQNATLTITGTSKPFSPGPVLR